MNWKGPGPGLQRHELNPKPGFTLPAGRREEPLRAGSKTTLGEGEYSGKPEWPPYLSKTNGTSPSGSLRLKARWSKNSGSNFQLAGMRGLREKRPLSASIR